MTSSDEKFIERIFPIKDIGEEAAAEKNNHSGHISTIHVWWSRKPLTASRASIYASLVPFSNEYARTKNFITKLSKLENTSNLNIIDIAIKDILNANNEIPPKILDPFGGGGSIPLEALRLGCDTYSNDINPVAVIIQKALLEFPVKFPNISKDLVKWSNWVINEVKNEIYKYYERDIKGERIMGYLWANTLPCQNPTCNCEIPLIMQFWLANNKTRRIALYPIIDSAKKKISFKIIGTGYGVIPSNFDPKEGTIAKGIILCPICGATIEAALTRQLFQEGKAGQMMIAIITLKEKEKGKYYHIPNEKDIECYNFTEKELQVKITNLTDKWGLNPIPEEPLPPPGTLGFRIQRYNMNKWGDLYNSRQKLALLTFLEKIKTVKEKIVSLNQSEEYAKAVVTYLSLSLDMLAAFTNKLARWENTSQAIKHIFALQAIPMLWTYVESNPFSRSSGSWENGWGNYIKVIEQCAKIKNTPAIITQGSATALKYQDNYFDAIFTDPPYYDNIPYSHLSDFFYVWLKRSIGDLYPELFSTELVPKRNEIVAYSDSKQDSNQGKNGFESMLKKSFQEIHRILKPNGIAVIIYTHKSNEGWESLINSLLDSELIISAAWPVNTEMQTRLRAKESATLASSIYIIARKMKRKSPVLYNQIRDELMTNLNLRMNEIWNEGISGADFMISAIGLSIPIYGKFEKVIDYEGNSIRADKYLEDVRAIVMDFSIKQILHSNLSEGLSNLTKYYLFWRVNFGESEVIFDEANKLARSCSLDISQTTSFIKKNKENISILGPHQRDLELIKGSNELIDVLHTVLLYWEKSMRDDITNHLKNTGFGKSEMFYKIAQAISETLPNESKEKKLLDGFLAGKERMKDEVKKEIKQKSLDEMIKR